MGRNDMIEFLAAAGATTIVILVIIGIVSLVDNAWRK